MAYIAIAALIIVLLVGICYIIDISIRSTWGPPPEPTPPDTVDFARDVKIPYNDITSSNIDDATITATGYYNQTTGYGGFHILVQADLTASATPTILDFDLAPTIGFLGDTHLPIRSLVVADSGDVIFINRLLTSTQYQATVQNPSVAGFECSFTLTYVKQV
jgi:hypothetical protein